MTDQIARAGRSLLRPHVFLGQRPSAREAAARRLQGPQDFGIGQHLDRLAERFILLDFKSTPAGTPFRVMAIAAFSGPSCLRSSRKRRFTVDAGSTSVASSVIIIVTT